MPKNCLMCQFHGFGGYKNEFIVCSLTGRIEGQLSNVPDCPLVEVPTPHGPLIDEAALMLEFAEFVRASNNSDFAAVPTWNDAVSLLGSAPTIIEAEE